MKHLPLLVCYLNWTYFSLFQPVSCDIFPNFLGIVPKISVTGNESSTTWFVTKRQNDCRIIHFLSEHFYACGEICKWQRRGVVLIVLKSDRKHTTKRYHCKKQSCKKHTYIHTWNRYNNLLNILSSFGIWAQIREEHLACQSEIDDADHARPRSGCGGFSVGSGSFRAAGTARRVTGSATPRQPSGAPRGNRQLTGPATARLWRKVKGARGNTCPFSDLRGMLLARPRRPQ